jgi:uncharacterized membrane protein YphA (DoxX/SURF4 family)
MAFFSILYGFGISFLSFIYVFTGISKLHPFLSAHASLILEDSFNYTFQPLWQLLLNKHHINLVIDPYIFKQIIGSIEILCSFGIIIGGYTRRISAFILFLLMLGATYTNSMSNSSTLMPLFMCSLCLWISMR